MTQNTSNNVRRSSRRYKHTYFIRTTDSITINNKYTYLRLKNNIITPAPATMTSIINLLQHETHWGHPTHERHPDNKKFIFGKYNGFDMIDLFATTIHLKKTFQGLSYLVKRKSKLLLVTDELYLKNIDFPIEIPTIGTKWIGGTLNNYHSGITKYIYKNTTFNNLKNLRGIPHAVIIISSNKEQTASIIAEAARSSILVFSLLDTNTMLHNIPYPIPSNDNSLLTATFMLKLINNAYIAGSIRNILRLKSINKHKHTAIHNNRYNNRYNNRNNYKHNRKHFFKHNLKYMGPRQL